MKNSLCLNINFNLIFLIYLLYSIYIYIYNTVITNGREVFSLSHLCYIITYLISLSTSLTDHHVDLLVGISVHILVP